MTKVLQDILLEIIPSQHRWKVTLLKEWPSIIGHLGSRVVIEKITDDCLFLGVCHPSWAQELFLLSSVIKQKINAVLAENRIVDIKFRVMPKPTSKLLTVRAPFQNAQQVKTKINLSEKEAKHLYEVKNEILRNALHDFYTRCKGNQKGDFKCF